MVEKQAEKQPNDAKKKCQTGKKENSFAVLKSLIQQLKPESLDNFQEQIRDLIDNFQENEQSGCCQNGSAARTSSDNAARKKVFRHRESLLTMMFEMDHIKTIHNFFVALLILFGLNTLLYDYLETGRAHINLSTFSWAFGSLCSVVSAWMKMFAYTLLAFPLSSACFCNRTTLALPLYLIYLAIFAYFPLADIRRYELPPASTMIVVAEQVRLFMKIHSFVRENAPKYYSKPTGHEVRTAVMPTFQHFVYFLFAPTLIYRDEYPRKKSICWKFVLANAAETCMAVLYLYYLVARFCIPVFKNTGKEPGSIRAMLLGSFSCMLPGTMILILVFFGFLHCWLNAFAELLRFADRQFYRDWWNSTSYAAWYRNWNVVVHDWLYAYVYQEIQHVFGKRGRLVGLLLVFFLSAVVHEYILSVAFGFIFPALLVTFGGLGLLFVFLKPRSLSKQSSAAWNTFMWTSLIMGNGTLMYLYSHEWYANMNCPRTAISFSELLIPRSWNSDCVEWTWDIPLSR